MMLEKTRVIIEPNWGQVIQTNMAIALILLIMMVTLLVFIIKKGKKNERF